MKTKQNHDSMQMSCQYWVALHRWRHDSVDDFSGRGSPGAWWTLWDALNPLHCSWTSLLEVNPVNGSFMCNIIWSNFFACEAILTQSEYGCMSFLEVTFENTMTGSTYSPFYSNGFAFIIQWLITEWYYSLLFTLSHVLMRWLVKLC